MNVEIVNGKPYLPGVCSLLEQLDKKILVILRDGRHLVGILRSFDQFSNIMMQNTCERAIIPEAGKYCDIPLGLYVVRGEGIMIIGELDEAAETSVGSMQEISVEEFSELEAEFGKSTAMSIWDADNMLQ